MKFSARRQTTRKILIGLIGLIALFSFWLYLNNNLIAPRASANDVNISLIPKTGTFPIAEPQTIQVVIAAQEGKKISGVDITFRGTGGAIITDVSAVKSSSNSNANFNQIVRQVPGTTEARITYVSTDSASALPQSVTIDVTLRRLSAGQGGLTIDRAATQIVGTADGNQFGLGSIDEGQYTFEQGAPGVSPSPSVSSAAAPPAILEFVPRASSIGIGQNGSVDFRVRTTNPSHKVSGFSAVITFPQELVEVIDIQERFTQAEYSSLRRNIDNVGGRVVLTYISQRPSSELATSASIGLIMRGKSQGTGTLQILQTQVTGNIPENAYTAQAQDGSLSVSTVTAVPTATPGVSIQPPRSPTVTPIQVPTLPITVAPPGNVTLNMQLRFQGIVTGPQASQTLPVTVSLAGGPLGGREVSSIAKFTANAQGIWSGSPTFNVPVGTGYRVLVKGGKHIQKKICEVQVSETAPGTYRCGDGAVEVKAGQNSLNYSGIVLLVGDLPEQGTVGQNGVIDAYDVSYVRNNLGSRDPRVLEVGDLNLDGIIDSQDFSLIIASLSVKYDEK